MNNFDNDTLRAMSTMVAYGKISSGSTRDVYHHALDDDSVVKIARSDNVFEGIKANIAEWEMYDRMRHWTGGYEWQKEWLAPCYTISNCGRILLMAKTEPCPRRMLPKVVPVWATDLKQSNVGIFEGRVVFHDYGLNLSLEEGSPNRVKLAGEWG